MNDQSIPEDQSTGEDEQSLYDGAEKKAQREYVRGDGHGGGDVQKGPYMAGEEAGEAMEEQGVHEQKGQVLAESERTPAIPFPVGFVLKERLYLGAVN